MVFYLKRPWIEKALLCEDKEQLPEKVKAQVIEVWCAGGTFLSVLNDKEMFIKAIFSEKAISNFFESDDMQAYESFKKIVGGFIVINKYQVLPETRVKMQFVIAIEEFKIFGGGEGTRLCQDFGKKIIDHTEHPDVEAKLICLWEREEERKQLLELCRRYSPSFATEGKSWAEIEIFLSEVHKNTGVLFTESSSQCVDEDEVDHSFETPDADLSHSKKDSSISSEPVYLKQLVNYTGQESLVVDGIDTSIEESSQSQSFSCSIYSQSNPNSFSETFIEESGDLSLLIELAHELLAKEKESEKEEAQGEGEGKRKGRGKGKEK